jgi:hypothetical protein
MRTKLVISCAILAFGVLSTGAVLAQVVNSADALSGTPLGTMTCSEFTKMSPTARADIVAKIRTNNPDSSVTSNSGGAGAAAPGSSNASNAAAVGTPLQAGPLIAACQAASADSTVKDAYSQSMSSSKDMSK